MTLRIVVFALCLAAGGLLGDLVAGGPGAEAGLVAGAATWFVIDSMRGLRALRWLRGGDLRHPPRLGGLWGEAMDRVRRAATQRDQRLQEAAGRLEDFRAAIRASPNGVVLLDRQGRIEWLNETAAAHFGFDPERDVQQHVVHLLRDPAFSAYFAARDEAAGDLLIAAPASTPSRPRRLSLRLHPYGEGRLLMLSRDVTAVEQAELMRRDFVANVSHEIRTPLTVLSGFVETLQSLELPKEERLRYLQMMGQQTQRMQTLVSDLLTLSRLEGSPRPGAGDWTPLAGFFAQCEEEARGLLLATGKTLQLEFVAAPDVAIDGAAVELQSAFSNLVSNAVRYTPAGGSVHVSALQEADGRLAFAVRDTGPGVPPEHLPRLSERFYRVDRSRSRETGGTGLGLAIVKHVAQRHGGELRIQSTPGTGSTFTVLLPAARVRPAPPAGSAGPPATGSAAG